MKDQLISFKTAKLAKEKGFDGLCYDCFNDHGNLLSNGWCEYIFDKNIVIPFLSNDLNRKDTLRPSQSLLQKWLREVHNLHITIFSSSQESWMFRITKPHQKLEDGLYGEDYNDYEEALEAGLLKTLTLI